MDCWPRPCSLTGASRSTSDIGDIVYNLIAAGDLEKTESDSRSDFDNVFDFETAFKAASPRRPTIRPQNPAAIPIRRRIETSKEGSRT